MYSAPTCCSSDFRSAPTLQQTSLPKGVLGSVLPPGWVTCCLELWPLWMVRAAHFLGLNFRPAQLAIAWASSGVWLGRWPGCRGHGFDWPAGNPDPGTPSNARMTTFITRSKSMGKEGTPVFTPHRQGI